MQNKLKRFIQSSVLIAIAIAGSGCRAPAEPVVTVWQRLGIPQAATRLRDGITNRRGNRPGLERKPPVLRLADPENLLSENKAIKAAAEIKMEEDLKQQKLKALKYLATIGCGCYDKEGKVEEALLQALEDCTEEVRAQAAKTVAEAAGTCACKYDGCTPSCCTKKIVKRLYDMAYEVDDQGCPIEPSCEVRKLAARAVKACGAVPQPADPVEPKKNDDEALPKPVTPELPGEEVPAPEATPVEASTRASKNATALLQIGDDVPADFEYIEEEGSELSAPSNSSVVSTSTTVTPPDDMVLGTMAEPASEDRAVVILDGEYEIYAGEKLLLLSPDGRSTVSEILAVDGAKIEVDAKEVASLRIAANSNVFVGLMEN